MNRTWISPLLVVWLALIGTALAQNKADPKAEDPEIEGKPLTHWIGQLKSKEAKARETAAENVGRAKGAAKKAIPQLAALLNDEDDQVRSMAGTALIEIGPDSVPAFMQALKHKNPKVRWQGALGLAGIGPAAKAGVPSLIAALKDPDMTVRCHAAEALGAIGPDAKNAVPSLIGLLKSPDADTRYSAAVGLGGIGPDAKAAIAILKTLATDPDPTVREGAAKALPKIEAK